MSTSVPETSLSADIFRYIRYQLRGRRGLIVAAIALGVPALWLGWPWLVMAGLAPLLIALAPCAIMCGLGLCVMKSCSKTGSGEASSCSKSQAGDQTAASVAANGSTDEATAPLAIAAPSNRDLGSVEDPSFTQPAQADSASNLGEVDCCSKSQGDQTAAPVAATKSTNGVAQPLPIADPSDTNLDSVDGQTVPQPEHAGPLAGKTPNQEKETFH
ncbi:hypothetical protein [Nitratireductor luteus]|uniref:hypothetical protein n=1 Tax=Nitratireductor luteus TaxID=2976980 RepID=UPI00223F887D|nr:hypothetical protein [Nitratireductor luteus]